MRDPRDTGVHDINYCRTCGWVTEQREDIQPISVERERVHVICFVCNHEKRVYERLTTFKEIDWDQIK